LKIKIILFLLFLSIQLFALDNRLLGTWKLNVGNLNHDFSFIVFPNGAFAFSGYYINRNMQRVNLKLNIPRALSNNFSSIESASPFVFDNAMGRISIQYTFQGNTLIFTNISIQGRNPQETNYLSYYFDLNGATFIRQFAPKQGW